MSTHRDALVKYDLRVNIVLTATALIAVAAYLVQ